jgi:hypothetical protein
MAKFKDLNRLRINVYKRRDASLIDQVLTGDSPLRRAAYRDIARLRTDHVLDRTKYKVRAIRARLNRPTRIVLREVEVQTPRFVTESGRDVSRLHVSLLVTTDWTLRKDGLSWKIFDSSVLKARRLRSSS